MLRARQVTAAASCIIGGAVCRPTPSYTTLRLCVLRACQVTAAASCIIGGAVCHPTPSYTHSYTRQMCRLHLECTDSFIASGKTYRIEYYLETCEKGLSNPTGTANIRGVFITKLPCNQIFLYVSDNAITTCFSCEWIKVAFLYIHIFGCYCVVLFNHTGRISCGLQPLQMNTYSYLQKMLLLFV